MDSTPRFKTFSLLPLIIFVISSISYAQENAASTKAPERRLFSDILSEQRAIWTSPKHMKGRDLKWLVPFAGLTAALIATDDHFSKQLSYSKSQLSISHSVSDIGVYGMYGAIGALYLDGHFAHQEGRIKTGLLGGEAIASSEIVGGLLKITTRRQRPNAPGSDGSFWVGGESFPSGHSISAWSAATVLANRYPDKRWLKFGVYGLASAISAARFTGKNHYPSDVVVGGVLEGGRSILGGKVMTTKKQQTTTACTVCLPWDLLLSPKIRAKERGRP
jgi:hypothetical protein